MRLWVPQIVFFKVMEILFLSFKWKNMRVGEFVKQLLVVPLKICILPKDFLQTVLSSYKYDEYRIKLYVNTHNKNCLVLFSSLGWPNLTFISLITNF